MTPSKLPLIHNPAKQTTLCLWHVLNTTKLKQYMLSVHSVCSNKALPGCLVWDESAWFEVMHMWCDSLLLCSLFSWAYYISSNCGLTRAEHCGLRSALGVLCSAVQPHTGRPARVNTRPLPPSRMREHNIGGELNAGKTQLPNFKLKSYELVLLQNEPNSTRKSGFSLCEVSYLLSLYTVIC